MFGGSDLIFNLINSIINICQYRLSKNKAAIEKPALEFVLKSKNVIKLKEKYIYYFCVVVNNVSRINNSISDISLLIHYRRGSKSFHMNFPYKNSSSDTDIGLSELPKHIEAGSSVKLNIAFEVAEQFKIDNEIDYYELIFIDTYGNKKKIPVTIICEADTYE
ncbi:hypothetical protein Thit_0666 [Thermoanaerobacter italicus Ab9]|uniref:DUF4352 domain-containing protein n=1 Tax=Thermoanaerobacter italicus (strain DSM 9252 / Ab9) TaxID=580331 RepID=D3T7N2_THEIA|nr:hypothetical protein [Thermoanaerobacter italicus]ADD01964.1 hypothetical protein Thit_0666 [Thermoanaerobacter italicus Ab9]